MFLFELYTKSLDIISNTSVTTTVKPTQASIIMQQQQQQQLKLSPLHPPIQQQASERNNEIFLGMDIGGSLCKVCFHHPPPTSLHTTSHQQSLLANFLAQSTHYGSTGQRDAVLSIETRDGGVLHFMLFETRRIESALALIRASVGDEFQGTRVPMTGGGAYKYRHLFEEFASVKGKSGVVVEVKDEMRCLVEGLNYLLLYLPAECFFYKCPTSDFSVQHGTVDDIPVHGASTKHDFLIAADEALPPYLLVNIGTGVSILKVESNGTFERVSGSGLGGGTYWGLVKLLTKYTTFNESLQQSLVGQSRNVDMTVGDIYGGDYQSLGLNADMTASFFGKLVPRDEPSLRDNISDPDICHALLLMVTNNIGQIAYLLAKLHNVQHILFSGSFLRHSAEVDIAPVALTKAIEFWSGGQMKALFLKHEGYFGALGAFLSESQEQDK